MIPALKVILIYRDGDNLVVESQVGSGVRFDVAVESITYRTDDVVQIRIPAPEAQAYGGYGDAVALNAEFGRLREAYAGPKRETGESHVDRLLRELSAVELTQDDAARVIAALRQRIRL
jgi:hypothetical protein